MIVFSANVQNAIASLNSETFYAVSIVSETGVPWKRLTTYPADLTIDGALYYGNGEIVAMDPPKISTNVDREAFRISLADPAFMNAVDVDLGLINYRVRVLAGFTNPSTGVPMTDLSDMLHVYSGRVDSTGYRMGTQEAGEANLQLVCSSPMADLDLKKGIFTSRDYVRGKNPRDSSCDHVYAGSGVLSIKWGKS